MTSFFSKDYFKKGIESGDFIEYETSVEGIEIFIKKGTPRCFIFEGRKRKPDAHLFKDNKALILYVESRVQKIFDKNIRKEEQKERDRILAEENRQTVHVGDIFSTSWGYDRTIVEFFEVVERVSDAYVNVRQISATTVSQSAMSSHIKPVVGSYIGPVKKCQINKHGHIVKADDYGHTAYKTKADAEHYTSWD